MQTDVIIANTAVLAAVLATDLGTRTVTWRRVVRPIVIAAAVVAIFVKAPQTSGTGLALELLGLAGGLALGSLGSHRLMKIGGDAATGTQVSIAGVGYAAFWILAIGARVAFTYGADHWYGPALGQWMAMHAVTVDGLTDALVLASIGLVLARAIRFARILRHADRHPAGPIAARA